MKPAIGHKRQIMLLKKRAKGVSREILFIIWRILWVYGS